MGFLLIFFKWIMLLLLGVFIVLLFFYFKNRKSKNFSSDIKKLIKYKNIIYDKGLHENFLLKESYISSVERLKNFLLKIYKSKNNYFNLSPLDALMLIEIFPFDIRKSKDGKYYIINQTEFELFLKLLLNKNFHFISDEALLELRDKLVKKLLSWDDKIVIDVNFIFNLINSDNLPNDDIENQKFVTLATKFNNEKVLFRIEDVIENNDINKNENEKKTSKKNILKNDEVIIKGKDKDYIIDLKRGIQYVVNKVTEKEKKESKEDKLNKLLENLTLLIASQPQQIANSIQEIITKTNFNNLDENSLKRLLKEEIVEKAIDNQNNSKILNTTNKLLDEIFGKEPNLYQDIAHENNSLEKSIIPNENKTNNYENTTINEVPKNINEVSKNYEDNNQKNIKDNKTKSSNIDVFKNKDSNHNNEDNNDININSENNEQSLPLPKEFIPNNNITNEKKKEDNDALSKNGTLNNVDIKSNLLNAISSDNFVNDFGISDINKQSKENSQNLYKNREIKEFEIDNLSHNKKDLECDLKDEILFGILDKYFKVNKIEKEFINKILDDVLIRSDELAFYQIDKTYYLKLKDFLHSILFVDFGIKILNSREEKIAEIIKNIDCKEILNFVKNIYSDLVKSNDFIPAYLVISLNNNQKEFYIPFVYKINEEFYKIRKEKKNILITYKNAKKVTKC